MYMPLLEYAGGSFAPSIAFFTYAFRVDLGIAFFDRRSAESDCCHFRLRLRVGSDRLIRF